MKPIEKQTRVLFCLALLVGFCAASTPCLAQEGAKQDDNLFGAAAEVAKPRPIGDPDEYTSVLHNLTFDIIFTEPTSVEEFVAVLREKTNNRINIIVNNDARKVMLPSFELRGVSTASALIAMDVTTQGEVTWDDLQEGFIQIVRNAGVKLKVFNVSHIVDRNDQAEASMLSAIEIGLEMNNSSPENVSLKFHEETKLLFIRASDTDLDIVVQVLEQLGGRSLTQRLIW